MDLLLPHRPTSRRCAAQRLPIYLERPPPGLVLDPEVVADRQQLLPHLVTVCVSASPEGLPLFPPFLAAFTTEQHRLPGFSLDIPRPDTRQRQHRRFRIRRDGFLRWVDDSHAAAL